MHDVHPLHRVLGIFSATKFPSVMGLWIFTNAISLTNQSLLSPPNWLQCGEDPVNVTTTEPYLRPEATYAINHFTIYNIGAHRKHFKHCSNRKAWNMIQVVSSTRLVILRHRPC